MASRSLKPPAERVAPAPGAGFSLEDVKLLVQLVEESQVTHIAWQRGSEKVVIRRGGGVAPLPPLGHPAPVTAVVPIPAPAAAPGREGKLDLPGVVVSSPFVGTRQSSRP